MNKNNSFRVFSGKIRKPEDIENILSTRVERSDLIKSGEKKEIYNIPCAFDIETTSFRVEGEKQSIMYEWTLGINGEIIIGRTWEEFEIVYEKIVKTLRLNSNRHLMVYVHNLAFEFQFIRKHFQWEKVFGLEERRPIYAITSEGVEFRCSYLLSGYSLSILGNQLIKYKAKKMVGDLNYHLYRHSKTPLTDEEIEYCVNDVLIVMYYIQEKIENEGDISKIPLTKTGYVRNYCRNSCLYEGNTHKKNGYKFLNYREIMKGLTLSVDEYHQLKRAFQGGFTHANAFYSMEICEDVTSYDFTSSYPAVMISEKFPMSRGQKVIIKSDGEFKKNLSLYCCLFDIAFYNLQSTTLFEHYISSSKCFKKSKVIEDNGRVVQAGFIVTTITEQDFFIIEKFYKWDYHIIGDFRRYRKGYLPTDFVKAILTLYENKTTLKSVSGKEAEYLNMKEMLNAAYGMAVTDICRPIISYSEQWGKTEENEENEIEKYNKSIKRFLFYPWGVWVTAYARKNLFSGIWECQDDYVYSDTDSIKFLNAEKHLDYIEKYNTMISEKIENALTYHKIPFEKAKPKTVKGDEKMIGVWDFDGHYKRFKTLGAKRYMTENDKGEISLTVSGVNKKTAIPYLLKKYGEKIFEAFDEFLIIPAKNDLKEHIFDEEGVEIDNPCGKNTHTYVDEEMTGIITDYLGTPLEYRELSGVHLEAADYTLSLSELYANYILGIREYNK